MAKKRVFGISVIALLLLGAPLVHGQQSVTMSLEECLAYAKEQSITLQQAELLIEDSASQSLSAKGAMLPYVSGSVSQGLVGYPLSDSDSSGSIYSGSYGVDLSMTLYSGGGNRAQISKGALGEKIAVAERDEASNSLELSITEIYVEILYAMEQIKVAQSSLELSEKSEERGRAFLEVGSINEADFAQLESATATSRYDIVVAQTQLSNLYVALRYLLEIPIDLDFSIREIPISDEILLAAIPTSSDVYSSALESRPEIQSSKLYIKSAEADYTIAKSNFLPTLSLTAGTGVNHLSSSSYDFSSQMRNNFTTSVGLNLSIPIFSGYVNRSNVAIAQNSVKRASLSLTQSQKDLYQTIETLRNNAANSQALYAVSQYLLQSTLKSMELTQQQYEVGLKSTIELLTEQENYNQTCQEHLVNKYQLLLNKALLNYYKTNIIKL